jgi:NAD(P)-dependent dehydrogenase (short-subunit alcohol dehydrogenase family)
VALISPKPHKKDNIMASVDLISGLYGVLLAFGIMLLAVLLLPLVVYLISRKRYPTLKTLSSTKTLGGVLVTGASTGIGRHAAFYLARQGFLVFAGVRKPADGEGLLKAYLDQESKQTSKSRSRGKVSPTKEGVLHYLILDITKPFQIAAAVRSVQEELSRRGGLPFLGLVNNAGVTGGADPVEFLPLEHNRNTFEVNFYGPLAVTQAFLPLLRQAPQGRIVNVSSMAGIVTRPLGATYSCTKFALEALSDTLRVELGHLGVSVSVIQPGYIRSEIFGKADEQHQNRMQELPVECSALYGHLYTVDKTNALIAKASDPIVCSRAIHHALTSPYPKVSLFWIRRACGRRSSCFSIYPQELFY